MMMRFWRLSFLLLLHFVNGAWAAWQTADWEEFPYMVQLWREGDDEKWRYICGGSIICQSNKDNKGVILTAAHCADEPSHLGVIVGSTIYPLANDSVTPYRVESINIHPGYDATSRLSQQTYNNHDIAVLILDEAIDHAGAIATVLEQDMTNIDDNDEIKVSGYGSGGPHLYRLEYFVTNFMQTEECDAFFEEHWNDDIEALYGAAYNDHITGDDDFCVLDEEADKDNWCNGDSGGPLVYGEFRKQIGVVSWSIKPEGECDHEWPTMAASVPTYYDWIVEQANCVDCAGKGLSFGDGRAHNCECKAACDTRNEGPHCHIIEDIAFRLREDLGDSELCSSGVCCCSCPDCKDWIAVE